jgi:hypothetical protein
MVAREVRLTRATYWGSGGPCLRLGPPSWSVYCLLKAYFGGGGIRFVSPPQTTPETNSPEFWIEASWERQRPESATGVIFSGR